MFNVVSFMVGIFAGSFVELMLSIIFEDFFRNLWRKISRTLKWVLSQLKNSSENRKLENFHVGRYSTPCVVLEGYGEGYYETHKIISTLAKDKLILPKDLEINRKQVQEEQEKIKSESGSAQFHNGTMVALDSYRASRTAIYEDPCLVLNFIPTDYYTFLATSLMINSILKSEVYVNDTIRNKYIENRSLSDPCKFVATSFGVNLCIVTSDERTIFGKRSDFVSHYRGVFQAGVCESVLPEKDFGSDSIPIDVYKTAIRGGKEELGIDIDEKEIRFFSLNVDVDYYLYGLTGLINSKLSSSDIMSMRSIGVKDKIESSSINTPRFRPQEIVQFIDSNGGVRNWHPASFVAVIQSLVNLYGIKKVEEAFK